MTDIIKKAGLSPELQEKVQKQLNNNIDKIKSLADKCKGQGFYILKSVDSLTALSVCLYYASTYTRQQYKALGIDEGIFFDTIGDIGIWCNNNHNKGLKNTGWISNHLKGELFRIGRLQYQLYSTKNKTLDYNALPFDYGERLIYVHIPQGEPLNFSKCVQSLKDAKAFFDKHFPDYEYRFFFCESWLLYGDNWMFMSPSCNILQFQCLFDIVYSVPDDKQAIERIFGKRHLIKTKYPEATTLQRQAKSFMLQGGKMGVGIGIISKNEPILNE